MSMTGTREGTAAELSWLARLLWGARGVEVSAGRPLPAGHRVEAAWGILPDRTRPRLLVPLGSPRAAATAMLQFNNAMTQPSRLAKAAVAAGLRTGGLQLLLRGRRQVLEVGGVGHPRTTADGPSLTEYLGDALGAREVCLAITVGSVRPNRKPVLQILRPDGATLGYAKLGWNDLTRRLVRREAERLRALEACPPRQFQVPRLLHQGTWTGLDVTVGSPLPHRLWRRGRRFAPPPPTATREVVGLGGAEEASLAASAYWRQLRERLAAVGAAVGESERSLLDGVARRLVGRYGDSTLTFGTWHGDWAPWNMGWSGRRLVVWDWERSADLVPVGFDLVHFLFRTAVGMGRDTAAAAAFAQRAGTGGLSLLGQRREAEELILTLYLLEMVCRYAEAEVSTVTGDPDRRLAAFLAVLADRPAVGREA
jgi:hypothetical protein